MQNQIQPEMLSVKDGWGWKPQHWRRWWRMRLTKKRCWLKGPKELWTLNLRMNIFHFIPRWNVFQPKVVGNTENILFLNPWIKGFFHCRHPLPHYICLTHWFMPFLSPFPGCLSSGYFLSTMSQWVPAWSPPLRTTARRSALQIMLGSHLGASPIVVVLLKTI